MSEMLFGDFIQRIRENPNEFWCLSTMAVKAYDIDEKKMVHIGSNTNFSDIKAKIQETKGMFSGKFYCGSVSIFFENEGDINLLRIKYPEILA